MSYIDRDDFINEAKSFVQRIDKPSIILIGADSGIGKHCAVQKLFEQTWLSSYKKISMHSYSANEDTSIIKNKYFFKIISLIRNDYVPFDIRNDKLSFYRFIKQNKQIKRNISNAISLQTLSDATEIKNINKVSIFTLLIKYIRNKIKLYDPDYYIDLLMGDSVNSANIGKEYLNYILYNDVVILELRATQFMDQETIYNLCNSLKKINKNSKSIIIMEYDTDSINNLSDFVIFRSMLQSAIGMDYVLSYDLKPLGLNDFIQALSMQLNQNMNIYSTWIKREYLESGTKSINSAINNFYRAEKRDLILDSIPIIDYNEYFDKIGAACLCILSILDIHGGRISMQLLTELYTNIDITLNEGYLHERIQLMINQHFIIEDNNDICFLNHDVKNIWEKYIKSTTVKSHGILVAATNCYDYYEKIVRNNENSQISAKISESIIILLKIIELYVPNRIINLSNYIHMIAKYFVSPEKAWQPISLLLNELSKYRNDYLETYYNIIDLCCDLELYKEALQIWCDIKEIAFNQNEYEFNRPNFIHCKVHYLSDKYDEVISFAHNQLQHEIRPTSELYYSIYLIITYRATNQYEKIPPIVNNINDNLMRFKNLPQYGLFLRISETYKSRTNAIPDVKESVKFFKDHGLEIQAAKAQTSLSFLYTITGELSNGLNSLLEAKSVLKKSYLHITCNNEAAIRLFQGKFDSYTEDLLKEAIMHSNGIFSNLVIYSNLMIFYYETSDETNLILRINEAKELLKSLVDKHLLAVISYNLHLFLKDIDLQESQKYYELAYNNMEHDAALKTRICNLEPQNACERFVLTKPWHVTMLSFWETDFMID